MNVVGIELSLQQENVSTISFFLQINALVERKENYRREDMSQSAVNEKWLNGLLIITYKSRSNLFTGKKIIKPYIFFLYTNYLCIINDI